MGEGRVTGLSASIPSQTLECSLALTTHGLEVHRLGTRGRGLYLCNHGGSIIYARFKFPNSSALESPTFPCVTPYLCSTQKSHKLLVSQWVNLLGSSLGLLLRHSPLPWEKNVSNTHLPNRQLRHDCDHKKYPVPKHIPRLTRVNASPGPGGVKVWSLDLRLISLSNSCFLGEERQCPHECLKMKTREIVEPLRNWASVSRWDSRNNQ